MGDVHGGASYDTKIVVTFKFFERELKIINFNFCYAQAHYRLVRKDWQKHIFLERPVSLYSHRYRHHNQGRNLVILRGGADIFDLI